MFELDATFSFLGVTYRGYGSIFSQADVPPEDPIVLNPCGYEGGPVPGPCVDELILGTNVLFDAGFERQRAYTNAPATYDPINFPAETSNYLIPYVSAAHGNAWAWSTGAFAPTSGFLLKETDDDYFLSAYPGQPRTGSYCVRMRAGGNRLYLANKRPCAAVGGTMGAVSTTPFYTAIVEADRTVSFTAYASKRQGPSLSSTILGTAFYSSTGALLATADTSTFLTSSSYVQVSRTVVAPPTAKFCHAWLDRSQSPSTPLFISDVDDLSVIVT